MDYVLNKLPRELKECVYKSNISIDVGMNYSLIRLAMVGCDFDLEPWAYNENPENDAPLSNFTCLHQRDVDRNIQLKGIVEVFKKI